MARRKYYDLYLDIDITRAKYFFPLVRHLGYRGIGLLIKENTEPSLIKSLYDIASTEQLEILFRFNKSISENLSLKQIKGRYLIVAEIKNEKDFRDKVRDKTIRLLSFAFEEFVNILSKENLNLLKQFPGRYIELQLSSLFNATRRARALALSNFYKKINLVNSSSLPLVISSGARNIEDLISPRCVRSLLRILGVKEKKILEAISHNPETLFKLPQSVIIMED